MINEIQRVADLANWSGWVPFTQAVVQAPQTPGVYLARRGNDGALVYVGKSGERRGMGIRGRLIIYSQGQAAVSGLGEAALDRALADRTWLLTRLAEVDTGRPRRATSWAREAIRWTDLYLCWHGTESEAAATRLEREVLSRLGDYPLWNRRRIVHDEQLRATAD